MLVNYNYNEYKALFVTGEIFTIFLVYSIVIGLFDEYFHFEVYHPTTTSMTILGAGVGIFLAFRINSGYTRWWEARIIWGGLVNVSRSFGMAITATLTNHRFSEMSDEEKSMQREILFNFIGFINALRLNLRKQGSDEWEQELWTREINGKKLFTQQESERLKEKVNIPTQIIQLISQKIAGCYDENRDNDFRYIHLLSLLEAFYDVQGKCERIKNTVFPWGYAYYTKRFVWLFAFLLPLGLLRGLDWPNMVVCAIVSTVFTTIEQVGRNLDNPFEFSFNDTPMSALCRVIEIDLLQQLNEPNVPEPLIPVDGVLY